MDSRWKWLFVASIFFYFALHTYFLDITYILQDEALYAIKTFHLRADLAYVFTPAAWVSHPPLIPLLAAFVPFVEPHIALRIVSILAGFISILLVFLIGKKFFGEDAGYLAASFLGVNHYFITYSHFGLLDLPLLTGILGVIAGAAYFPLVNVWKILLTGIVTSLIKAKAAIIFVPFVLVSILWKLRLSKKIPINFLIAGILLLTLIGGFLLYYFRIFTAFDQLIGNYFALFEMGTLVFWLFGVWKIWTLRNEISKFRLLFFWMLVGLAFPFFISYSGDAHRFLLLFLALMCLFVGSGVLNVVKRIPNQKIQVFLVVLVFIAPEILGGAFVLHLNEQGLGVGSLVSQFEGVEKGVIFTGFDWQLRYQFLLQGESGWVEYVRQFPYHPPEFEALISASEKPIYVIIGDTSNAFFGRFVDENYLGELGFKPFVEYDINRYADLDYSVSYVWKVYRLTD